MRRLYLLRHAKSSWELAGQLDYDRGLTERGHNDAKLIAGQIESRGIAPGLVICSGAVRTRETLEEIAPSLPPSSIVQYDDALYQASTEDLFDVVRAIAPEHSSVMLIGHNPSTHDFAVEIASGGDELVRMAAKFPTCALAEFELADEWSAVGTDSAVLTAFTAPKQLRKGEHETL